MNEWEWKSRRYSVRSLKTIHLSSICKLQRHQHKCKGIFLIWVTQTIAHQTSNLVFWGVAACRICVTLAPYKFFLKKKEKKGFSDLRRTKETKRGRQRKRGRGRIFHCIDLCECYGWSIDIPCGGAYRTAYIWENESREAVAESLYTGWYRAWPQWVCVFVCVCVCVCVCVHVRTHKVCVHLYFDPSACSMHSCVKRWERLFA